MLTSQIMKIHLKFFLKKVKEVYFFLQLETHFKTVLSGLIFHFSETWRTGKIFCEMREIRTRDLR